MAIPERRLELPYKQDKFPIKPFIPNFVNGGYVLQEQMNIPKDELPKNDKDRVLARLMPGEIVIPTKYVRRVGAFLKREGIKLPGLK